MSQADIERFTRDLQGDAKLREAVRTGAFGVASIVEIAKRHGYDVTVDEVRSHMRGRASQDLSDAQLEALAGGAGDPPPTTVGQVVVLVESVVAVQTTTQTTASASAPLAQVTVQVIA